MRTGSAVRYDRHDQDFFTVAFPQGDQGAEADQRIEKEELFPLQRIQQSGLFRRPADRTAADWWVLSWNHASRVSDFLFIVCGTRASCAKITGEKKAA